MSLPIIAGCFWVLIAAVVAMLPMRMQYPPGILLLLAAPILLAWIGYAHGWWIFAAGLFAFVSMFRNPLAYFARRLKGERPEVP